MSASFPQLSAEELKKKLELLSKAETDASSKDSKDLIASKVQISDKAQKTLRVAVYMCLWFFKGEATVIKIAEEIKRKLSQDIFTNDKTLEDSFPCFSEISALDTLTLCFAIEKVLCNFITLEIKCPKNLSPTHTTFIYKTPNSIKYPISSRKTVHGSDFSIMGQHESIIVFGDKPLRFHPKVFPKYTPLSPGFRAAYIILHKKLYERKQASIPQYLDIRNGEGVDAATLKKLTNPHRSIKRGRGGRRGTPKTTSSPSISELPKYIIDTSKSSLEKLLAQTNDAKSGDTCPLCLSERDDIPWVACDGCGTWIHQVCDGVCANSQLIKLALANGLVSTQDYSQQVAAESFLEKGFLGSEVGYFCGVCRAKYALPHLGVVERSLLLNENLLKFLTGPSVASQFENAQKKSLGIPDSSGAHDEKRPKSEGGKRGRRRSRRKEEEEEEEESEDTHVSTRSSRRRKRHSRLRDDDEESAEEDTGDKRSSRQKHKRRHGGSVKDEDEEVSESSSHEEDFSLAYLHHLPPPHSFSLPLKFSDTLSYLDSRIQQGMMSIEEYQKEVLDVIKTVYDCESNASFFSIFRSILLPSFPLQHVVSFVCKLRGKDAITSLCSSGVSVTRDMVCQRLKKKGGFRGGSRGRSGKRSKGSRGKDITFASLARSLSIVELFLAYPRWLQILLVKIVGSPSTQKDADIALASASADMRPDKDVSSHENELPLPIHSSLALLRAVVFAPPVTHLENTLPSLASRLTALHSQYVKEMEKERLRILVKYGIEREKILQNTCMVQCLDLLQLMMGKRQAMAGGFEKKDIIKTELMKPSEPVTLDSDSTTVVSPFPMTSSISGIPPSLSSLSSVTPHTIHSVLDRRGITYSLFESIVHGIVSSVSSFDADLTSLSPYLCSSVDTVDGEEVVAEDEIDEIKNEVLNSNVISDRKKTMEAYLINMMMQMDHEHKI
ncbi:hypothetical protein ADUPG1_011942 [Aduncisulcus paluster]|uniref:Zinc finger PHD-type domain-containing protein n=1 Tax=Aduncisulcus paluster TaxID=2918883 RepID=A0ABQ5JYG9_9EUKA|nr:hypothetical protein ADUPG1_011942 [Aduncisulcus paluster]